MKPAEARDSSNKYHVRPWLYWENGPAQCVLWEPGLGNRRPSCKANPRYLTRPSRAIIGGGHGGTGPVRNVSAAEEPRGVRANPKQERWSAVVHLLLNWKFRLCFGQRNHTSTANSTGREKTLLVHENTKGSSAKSVAPPSTSGCVPTAESVASSTGDPVESSVGETSM